MNGKRDGFYYSSFMRGRERERARPREIRVRGGKAGDGQALPGSIM